MQDTSSVSLTPPETDGGDRVREHTDPERVLELDRAMHERVAEYVGASPDELTARINQLEQESDIERILEVNASALALTGVLLGIFKSRRFLVLPVLVMGFLLQHGIQGWCPPLVPLRRLGVRTRQEIDAEKYALKAMRGDFNPLIT